MCLLFYYNCWTISQSYVSYPCCGCDSLGAFCIIWLLNDDDDDDDDDDYDDDDDDDD